MAAPSKSFTVIPDGDIDPDSPLTTGLFTSLRDNDVHVEEWLGKNYVAAVDHDHDGVNSAVATRTASIFDQATGQANTSASATFVDLATITVASGDLPDNRNAMIIASGEAQSSAAASFEVRLLVAGVAKQTLAANAASDTTSGEIFALSEIVLLTGGASRDIKVQGRRLTGVQTVFFAGVNLFSVLIT